MQNETNFQCRRSAKLKSLSNDRMLIKFIPMYVQLWASHIVFWLEGVRAREALWKRTVSIDAQMLVKTWWNSFKKEL